jgi:hypothetical protein
VQAEHAVSHFRQRPTEISKNSPEEHDEGGVTRAEFLHNLVGSNRTVPSMAPPSQILFETPLTVKVDELSYTLFPCGQIHGSFTSFPLTTQVPDSFLQAAEVHIRALHWCLHFTSSPPAFARSPGVGMSENFLAPLVRPAVVVAHCLSRLSRHFLPKHVDGTPSAAVHAVPHFFPTSDGQMAEAPEHTSCTSQSALAAARQTVPLVLNMPLLSQQASEAEHCLEAFSLHVAQSQVASATLPQSHCSPKSMPPFPHLGTTARENSCLQDPPEHIPKRVPYGSAENQQGVPSGTGICLPWVEKAWPHA